MPKRKRSTAVNAQFKKPRLTRKSVTLAQVNRKVNKLIYSKEVKHFDGSYDNTIPNTGAIVAITDIPQGDTEQTRDGNQVFVKSLHLKLWVKKNVNATHSALRYLIVKDTRNAGAAPTLAEIFEGSANVLDFLEVNDASRGRFKVIRSGMINQDDVSKGSFYEDWYIKQNQKITFDGSSGSDYANNTYWGIFVSDQDVATGDMPTISFYYRVGYTDS
jgi:hypothetical protein